MRYLFETIENDKEHEYSVFCMLARVSWNLSLSVTDLFFVRRFLHADLQRNHLRPACERLENCTEYSREPAARYRLFVRSFLLFHCFDSGFCLSSPSLYVLTRCCCRCCCSVVLAGLYIEDLSEFVVRSPEEVMEYLNQGRDRLVFAETKMNRASSRSHAVCRITVERRDKVTPHLPLSV